MFLLSVSQMINSPLLPASFIVVPASPDLTQVLFLSSLAVREAANTNKPPKAINPASVIRSIAFFHINSHFEIWDEGNLKMLQFLIEFVVNVY